MVRGTGTGTGRGRGRLIWSTVMEWETSIYRHRNFISMRCGQFRKVTELTILHRKEIKLLWWHAEITRNFYTDRVGNITKQLRSSRIMNQRFQKHVSVIVSWNCERLSRRVEIYAGNGKTICLSCMTEMTTCCWKTFAPFFGNAVSAAKFRWIRWIGSEAAEDYGRKALWKRILWLRATCFNPKRTSVMPQHTYCRLLLEFHSEYRQK